MNQRADQGGRRNFLFQHPRFGTKAKPRPEKDWKGTAYYLWWEYLRRHEGYKRCCERGGGGRYGGLHADFGNVHGVSFKDWWQRRGALLFCEPLEMNVHEVGDGEDLRSLDRKRVGVLVVPLHMRKGYLVKAFKRFLDRRHQPEAIKKRRVSRARYPIAGRTPVTKALNKTLAVYDTRLRMPNAKLWEIAEANEIGTRLSRRANPLDLPDIRRSQTVQVARYLQHARGYIANAGLGRFPVKTMPADGSS